MAEYDQGFVDRMMAMYNEELMAYLQTLSPAERKATQEAIFIAMSQRAVQEIHYYLSSGLQE